MYISHTTRYMYLLYSTAVERQRTITQQKQHICTTFVQRRPNVCFVFAVNHSSVAVL